MIPASTSKFFCFGLGFTGLRIARLLRDRGWAVGGTVRTPEKAGRLRSEGINAIAFDVDQTAEGATGAVIDAVRSADVFLQSAPPSASGDPAIRAFADTPAATLWGGKTWIGYLSTAGVYGDRQGQWTDEDTPAAPTSPRGKRRLAAEIAWQGIGAGSGAPVHIFRLPGIYGPGRSAIDQVLAGAARRIIKPNQVFNRIHVDDLAAAVLASIDRPGRGPVFNICDDEPAPSDEVVKEACRLLDRQIPEAVPFADAQLSEMARSFYAENKRLTNDRMKKLLEVRLVFPTYREGLRGILRETDMQNAGADDRPDTRDARTQ